MGFSGESLHLWYWVEGKLYRHFLFGTRACISENVRVGVFGGHFPRLYILIHTMSVMFNFLGYVWGFLVTSALDIAGMIFGKGWLRNRWIGIDK